jgi:hypothetical protein
VKEEENRKRATRFDHRQPDMSADKFHVEYHIPYVEEVLHHKQHLDVYSPLTEHVGNQVRSSMK